MKQVRLTNEELGALCLTLAHLCHAGIGAGDALTLLAEDETAKEHGALFAFMARRADEGAALSQIFRETGSFPDYACGSLEVGERVGRTEDSLNALARYYESRASMERRLRAALTYPAVLLTVMLAVVVVLLVWVLPVFNDVYAQLGSRLTGVAGGLLLLGTVLRKAMPGLCVLLAIIVIAVLVLMASPAVCQRLLAAWQDRQGDKGVNRQINTARFAQALSMGLSSGMTAQEAVALAIGLAEGDSFRARCENCLTQMDDGKTLASALRETELLSRADCRLLEAGMYAGSGESVMEKIAARLLEESELALEERAARIEPALVAAMSVMVGAILLSVMLPLMHIMTAIG